MMHLHGQFEGLDVSRHLVVVQMRRQLVIRVIEHCFRQLIAVGVGLLVTKCIAPCIDSMPSQTWKFLHLLRRTFRMACPLSAAEWAIV